MARYVMIHGILILKKRGIDVEYRLNRRTGFFRKNKLQENTKKIKKEGSMSSSLRKLGKTLEIGLWHFNKKNETRKTPAKIISIDDYDVCLWVSRT